MGLPVPQRDLMGWQFRALHHAWLGQILGPKLIALEQLFLRTDTYTQHLHLQVTGVNYFNREWNNNWKVRTNYILNLYFNEKEEHCHFIHKNNLIDNLKKKNTFFLKFILSFNIDFSVQKVRLGAQRRQSQNTIQTKQRKLPSFTDGSLGNYWRNSIFMKEYWATFQDNLHIQFYKQEEQTTTLLYIFWLDSSLKGIINKLK